MIKGNKPSGFGVTRDSFGREIVTEFRQCSHCQATWPYVKGANVGNRKVGLCDYCMGLLCTNCLKTRWKMVDKRCVPFSEGMEENTGKYQYTNSGIFIRK
jgi:hypothetical protein